MTDLAASDVSDKWDFYFCRVDDASASIFLNFWYEDHAPLRQADTLYWCDVVMLEPGEHGMGTASEAEALYPAEDRLSSAATEIGLYQVGRLRNHRRWMVAFFGRAGLEEQLSAAAAGVFGARKFDVGSKRDEDWSYYFEFLRPDAERRRWMQDRDVVDALQRHGDTLQKRRQVDHWIYFDSAAGRQRFLDVAQPEGFEVVDVRVDSDASREFVLQICRVDSVQLGDIHDVVDWLHQLARGNGGEYDGWETSVEVDET